MMTTGLPQVLRYPGSKARIAGWIVSHFPQHESYLEPFCGSAVVLCAKSLAPLETINDIDGRITNLFRVIRQEPERLAYAVEFTPWSRDDYLISLEDEGDDIERARRFLVRCWQSFNSSTSKNSGWLNNTRIIPQFQPEVVRWATVPDRIRAVAQRLKNVQIENSPALDLIRKVKSPNVLIYADPPYVSDQRPGHRYEFDMTAQADHGGLLDALCDHPGPVVLSAYDNDLYTSRLLGWARSVAKTTALESEPRREVLWLNPVAAGGTSQQRLDLL